MKIPKDLLEKYKIPEWLDDFNIYRTFLIATDYICNKLVEGDATKEDYAIELEYRKIARREISELLAK